LVAAWLGIASASTAFGRVAVAIDCVLIFGFAFQAGARLGNAGLSQKARAALGVPAKKDEVAPTPE